MRQAYAPSSAMITRKGRRRVSTTTEVFADVDRMDAKAFASHLAEDCLLRFGNAEELVGRDAIEESIAGFFTTINGISHQIVDQWDVDDTTIIRLEATYTRKDDSQVTLPAVAVWRRGGDLIDDYRIYVDLTPVYA
jgi:ketosteroid isomerase-like protein